MPPDAPTARAPEDHLRQACAELGRRLRAGERYGAEEAFATWPALAADADAAIELIYAEFTLREELGQTPTADEWYARFPQWEDRLRRLFAVHQADLPTFHQNSTDYPTASEFPGGSDTVSNRPGAYVGPYQLLGEIGRGGMGIVYKARHRGLGRVVALKMILSGQHAGAHQLARFRREAEAVARLQHPHIVQVFDVGEHRGTGGAVCPYMALEYVPGGSLAQRIARAPQPPRDAARLVEALAGAVQHAHDHGVVHRDLKPANVLLQWTEDSGLRTENAEQVVGKNRSLLTSDLCPLSSASPKVTDFGLARRLDATDGATHTGAVLGTPGYMAPEQAAGDARAAGPAADVYALGAILYEMLTGRPPFVGADWVTLLDQVRTADPVPPSRLEPGVPTDLETITLKCLEKSPARRYPSAAALGDDLRRFLDGRSVLARPPSAADQMRKFVRRNRGPVVAALLLVGTLVGGVIGTTWQALRATKARDLAEANELRATAGEASARGAAEKERVAKEAEAAQRRQAEAVADLLVSVFTELDPEQAQGDLRGQLIKRLDAVATVLDKEYAGEPLVRARLREALATTQAALGEYAKGLALQRQSFEERRDHLGPDHADTLTALNNLAVAHQHAGRLDEALPLYEQAFARRQATLGPDHLATFVSLCNLAAIYHHVGRLDEALPLDEQALAGLSKTLGPDHINTLRAMDNLATTYHHAGRLTEAVPLYEKALDRRTAILGPDHPDTLSSLNGLAGARRTAGRLDDAITLFDRALNGRKAKLGSDHPDTLASMVDLAVTYRMAHRSEKEAVALYEQALAGQKKKPGLDHPHTLTTMHNLAIAYWTDGRLAAAVPLLEQALAGRKVKLGADHADTLITTEALASAYEDHGQPERGEPLRRDYVASLRRTRGPQSIEVAGALTMLAANFLDRQQFAQAEPVLREGLAIRQAGWPDDWVTYHARTTLGASLLGQKKYAEAEPLLREGYEGMKQRRVKMPAAAKNIPARVAGQLAQVYEALGRPDQASAWRKQAGVAQESPGPDRP